MSQIKLHPAHDIMIGARVSTKHGDGIITGVDRKTYSIALYAIDLDKGDKLTLTSLEFELVQQ